MRPSASRIPLTPMLVGTMNAPPSAASTPGLSGCMPLTTGTPSPPAWRASTPQA